MKHLKYILPILILFLFTSCGNEPIEEVGFSDINVEEVILNKAYGNDSTNHYAVRIGGVNKDKLYVFNPDDGITVYMVRYRSGGDLMLLVFLSALVGMVFTFGGMAIINSD